MGYISFPVLNAIEVPNYNRMEVRVCGNKEKIGGEKANCQENGSKEGR